MASPAIGRDEEQALGARLAARMALEEASPSREPPSPITPRTAATASVGAEWFYVAEGSERRKEGPVGLAQLLRLHAEGTVHDSTLVWAKPMAAWTKMVLCSELRAVRPPLPCPTGTHPSLARRPLAQSP